MARGKLRMYLGAAPGVGKTYAMFSEAHRRVERGTDCVVAFVEHHHRPAHRGDAARSGGDPPQGTGVPRHRLHGIWTWTRCWPAAPRRPWSTSCPTNIPGSRNAKRWQDVEELLAAGIDVVSTVNLQHLESLGDDTDHRERLRICPPASVRQRCPESARGTAGVGAADSCCRRACRV